MKGKYVTCAHLWLRAITATFFKYTNCTSAILCFCLIAPVMAVAVSYSPSQAFHDGQHDAYPDGARAGQARGSEDGRTQGYHDAYHLNYQRCMREESQRQYDLGFRQGYLDGEIHGRHTGNNTGYQDGKAAGINKGQQDGEVQANRDADFTATPKGREQGLKEAEASDAAKQGEQAGLLVGEEDARKKAIDVDYPRGRQDYSKERFAEPIQYEDSFSQRSNNNLNLSLEDHPKHLIPPPDRRYYNPRPRPHYTSDERLAYFQGYQQGYHNGFNTYYQPAYQQSYSTGSTQGALAGCQAGRNQDFRRVYEQGRTAGYNEGYRHGYALAYQPAYDRGYQETYEPTRKAKYDATYPQAYKRYYELARLKAFQERSKQLYDEAFQRAYDQKFAQMYPVFAKEEYARGRAKEKEDFELRPVRLLFAQVTESNDNGVYEPGEALRVRLKLRNFNATSLAGRDIKIELVALNPKTSIISEREATLVKDLREKSTADISEALEFRVTESAANQEQQFTFLVHYKGRVVGDTVLKITPRFMVHFDLDSLSLKEGLRSSILVGLTNVSSQPTDSGMQVELKMQHPAVEIEKNNLNLEKIPAGTQSRATFHATARTLDPKIEVPFSLSAWALDRHRVGLLDRIFEVPVNNDYRIQTLHSLDKLRSAGIWRIQYRIKNISSRLVNRSLQITARVLGNAANQFTVIGHNPQYMPPLDKGETDEFIFPILVKNDNDGGTLEFEVLEEGVNVVTHRSSF